MFVVIYSFEVKEGKDANFREAWKALTELIYNNAGSYGSRLHKDESQLYVAYALWPDKNTWKNAKNHLPDTAGELRSILQDCCKKIETKYKLEMLEDLLKISNIKPENI